MYVFLNSFVYDFSKSVFQLLRENFYGLKDTEISSWVNESSIVEKRLISFFLERIFIFSQNKIKKDNHILVLIVFSHFFG